MNYMKAVVVNVNHPVEERIRSSVSSTKDSSPLSINFEWLQIRKLFSLLEVKIAFQKCSSDN